MLGLGACDGEGEGDEVVGANAGINGVGDDDGEVDVCGYIGATPGA